MDLHNILLKEFSDYVIGDWELFDSLDGNGPIISVWNRSEDEPTNAEILVFQSTHEDTIIEENKWIIIRSERDELLKASDYTQVADIPFDQTTKDAWLSYRVNLRNIPADFTNADDVIFPTIPS